MSHPGEAVRRRELVRAGWPHGAIVRENTLDAYVARLRRKLRGLERAPEIATVHGVGLQDHMRRLGLRGRLLLAVGIAVSAALVGLIAGFNLILAHVSIATRETSSAPAPSRRSTRYARAAADSACGRRPTIAPRIPICGSSPEPAHSSSLRATLNIDQRGKQCWRTGQARFLDVPGSDTRLYAAPVTSGGKRLGTIVAGVSLAPYEQTRKLALLASLVLRRTGPARRVGGRALAARRLAPAGRADDPTGS